MFPAAVYRHRQFVSNRLLVVKERRVRPSAKMVMRYLSMAQVWRLNGRTKRAATERAVLIALSPDEG